MPSRQSNQLWVPRNPFIFRSNILFADSNHTTVRCSRNLLSHGHSLGCQEIPQNWQRHRYLYKKIEDYNESASTTEKPNPIYPWSKPWWFWVSRLRLRLRLRNQQVFEQILGRRTPDSESQSTSCDEDWSSSCTDGGYPPMAMGRFLCMHLWRSWIQDTRLSTFCQRWFRMHSVNRVPYICLHCVLLDFWFTLSSARNIRTSRFSFTKSKIL